MIDEAVKNYGTLDILVNNAGHWTPRPCRQVTDQVWEKVSTV